MYRSAEQVVALEILKKIKKRVEVNDEYIFLIWIHRLIVSEKVAFEKLFRSEQITNIKIIIVLNKKILTFITPRKF